MASALDPNRIATLEHRLDVRLAARRAERAHRSSRSKRGAVTKQHEAFARDPLTRASTEARSA